MRNEDAYVFGEIEAHNERGASSMSIVLVPRLRPAALDDGQVN